MEILPGFITVPRGAGVSRPAGAFFSAVVLGSAGTGLWKVNLDGRTMVISSELGLVPGQTLKLKLASQTGARWVFQVVAEAPVLKETGPGSPLVTAFVSRGLPLVSERLAAWSRWLVQHSGPSDKETWAASLEARGNGPGASLTRAVEPWLAWQTTLEEGRESDPPEEDPWDEWNLRKTPAGDPWLVMPLRWEYQGRLDAGLLQAHWNPQGQRIDQWHLTAAPAGVPFRLEASSGPEELRLTWRFFRHADQTIWAKWADQEGPRLSLPGLKVLLTVAAPRQETTAPQGGIDVEV